MPTPRTRIRSGSFFMPWTLNRVLTELWRFLAVQNGQEGRSWEISPPASKFIVRIGTMLPKCRTVLTGPMISMTARSLPRGDPGGKVPEFPPLPRGRRPDIWKKSEFSRNYLLQSADVYVIIPCVSEQGRHTDIGMSPSGKAPDFDSGIRRFKSGHPSHTIR